MLTYPAILKRDGYASTKTHGTIRVEFPDVPEAHTFGESREEALNRAVDALETALSIYIDDRRPIPAPSDRKRNMQAVTLPALTEAKLALYIAMRTNRITKAELARRLKCHLPQVDRLLDLCHASRFDQLEAAFRALGKRLSVQISEAA